MNQDRLCIAVAKDLEKTFGGWKPPFTTSRSWIIYYLQLILEWLIYILFVYCIRKHFLMNYYIIKL